MTMLQFIDVNYIDAPKWDETKHPRGKGQKGGQFVKKGMGGASAPPSPTAGKVNIPQFVASELKKGTSIADLADKLKSATSQHINQGYIKKVFGQLEKTHNLPKGALSKGVGSYTPPSKPAPAPMPPPTPVTPPPSGASGVVAVMNKMDDAISAGYSSPIVTATLIKNIAKANPSVSAFNYANLKLSDLEKKHMVPKGTYAPTGWETAGPGGPAVAPGQSALKNFSDPSAFPEPKSQHQTNILNMAIDPNFSVQEKIKKITEYPTVANYPDGYTAKYAEQLVAKMGGTMPAKPTPAPYQPTPSYQPTPAPPPAPIVSQQIIKPLKPTKSWQEKQATFAQAKGAINDHWDSADAAKYFKSAEPNEYDLYSPGTRAAIKHYTGPGSGTINDHLRDPKQHIDPKTQKQIHDIYEAFEEPQSETKEHVKIWRGTNLSKAEFNKWKASLNSGLPAKPTLDGFTSASFYSDHPHFSHQPYWLEICVKKGTPSIAAAKGSTFGGKEGEILLQHGQQYEVLEIEENFKTKGHGTKTRIRLITI